MTKEEKQWVVYILLCKDETLYTGVTKNMDNRLIQHNSGKGAKYTRGRGPVSLLYKEDMKNQGDALRREMAIKKLNRTKKWQLING